MNNYDCNFEAAIRFSKKHGLPVFPVAVRKENYTDKNGKKVTFGAKAPKVKAPFENAVSAEEIESEWGKRKPCAFGAYPGVAGFAVVDIDVHGGKDGFASLKRWEEEHGVTLPETYTVRTPSGGVHLWFKSSTLKVGKDGFLEGVDIHGGHGSSGRYVVLPMQKIEAGEYVVEKDVPFAELPKEFADAVNGTIREQKAPESGAAALPADWSSDFSMILREIRGMEMIPCGRRDNTLAALCLDWKERGVTPDGMVELMNSMDALGKIEPGDDPLTESDFERISNSCWKKASAVFGSQSLETLLGESEEEKSEEDMLPIESMARFRESSPEARHSLIEGFMAHGKYLTLIYGRGGSGKSLLVQQMLRELGRNRAFLGLNPGDACSDLRSLLVSCEEPEEDVHFRFHKQTARIDPEGKGAEPLWCNLRGKSSYLFRKTRFGLEMTKLFRLLARKVKELKVNLVVIDSLSRVFPGNEIDRVDVTTFGKAMDAFCIETGCHVVVLAHTNKEGGFSGSSSWEAICRQMYIIEAKQIGGEYIYTMSVEKTNEGRRGLSVSYRFDDWYFTPVSEEEKAEKQKKAEQEKKDERQKAHEDAAGKALQEAIEILREQGGEMNRKDLTEALQAGGFTRNAARDAMKLGVEYGDFQVKKGKVDANRNYPTIIVLSAKLS